MMTCPILDIELCLDASNDTVACRDLVQGIIGWANLSDDVSSELVVIAFRQECRKEIQCLF